MRYKVGLHTEIKLRSIYQTEGRGHIMDLVDEYKQSPSVIDFPIINGIPCCTLKFDNVKQGVSYLKSVCNFREDSLRTGIYTIPLTDVCMVTSKAPLNTFYVVIEGVSKVTQRLEHKSDYIDTELVALTKGDLEAIKRRICVNNNLDTKTAIILFYQQVDQEIVTI